MPAGGSAAEDEVRHHNSSTGGAHHDLEFIPNETGRGHRKVLNKGIICINLCLNGPFWHLNQEHMVGETRTEKGRSRRYSSTSS